MGTVKSGTTIKIICQLEGPRIREGYDNNLWDKIGKGKFVSDSYVYTGSDLMVTPKCPTE